MHHVHAALSLPQCGGVQLIISEAKKLGIAEDKLEAILKSYREAVKKKDTAAATKAEKELEQPRQPKRKRNWNS